MPSLRCGVIRLETALVPELDRLLRKAVDPVFDRTASTYAKLIATSPRAAARTGRMVRVAFDFRTWQLGSGASDLEAARLLARAIAGVA